MNFKISTKEILHVISPLDPELSANMTEEILGEVKKYLKDPVANVVLDFSDIQVIDEKAASQLLDTQQEFYEQNHSLVICCLQKPVENFLESNSYLEQLNITPTVSEACDIVQMEEIERELLS